MAKKKSRQTSFLERNEEGSATAESPSLPPAPPAEPAPPRTEPPPRAEPGEPVVWVIDAHALIYQVFFAVGEMTSPAGRPVNAIFGFLRDILDLIEKRKPEWLICAFDRSDVTFRNELFDAYKAKRDPMPDDLREQIPVIWQLMDSLGIPCLDAGNYEADDILATIAREATERGHRCYLVTTDKDCRQLISEQVKLFNIRKNQIYDENSLLADWGVRPDQVVDFQAMVGDSVDNVPGIPSIGPKTAQKLIEEFGSLEGLLTGVDRIKSEKQRETIRANTTIARLCRDLVRLEDRVPVVIDWEKARVGGMNADRALELCNELGFRSLGLRIAKLSGSEPPPTWETRYTTVATSEELAALVEKLRSQPWISLDTETTSTNTRAARMVGFSLGWGAGDACYVPVLAPEGQPQLDFVTAVELVRPLLEDEKVGKIGQNLKFDLSVFRKAGIEIQGRLFDTMVADYLLDSGQRNHGIDDLARRYFNHRNKPITDLIGTGKNQKLMSEVDVPLITHYAAEDADVPFRLHPILSHQLAQAGLERLFEDVEIPLVRVLADMEYTGIRVDTERLEVLGTEFGKQMVERERHIHEIAGEPFNIDSPQQLATILFDRLQLPVQRKTASGRSTAAEVLEALADLHPLPREIIEYRQFAKLKSTYTDALIRLVNPETGRVHSSFMQDVAATGRLSSKDPNLQNIPIRTEAGRAIRQAFLPGYDDWLLLSADYSQIELRMLAHFTGDQALIGAFREGQDIHMTVAAEINGVAPQDVTPDMRRTAKSVNFGIIYGQTPFGLARTIGIGKEAAHDFIEAYFARYPAVEEFMRKTLTTAFREGAVKTILGRQRRIEGVRDPATLKKLRFLNFPERTAVNSVIQGSAADLIKLAMIRVHERLRRESLPAHLLLQIHDELLLEFDPLRMPEVARAVVEEMSGAFELAVPLQVDVEAGKSWASTSPVDLQHPGG